MKQTQISTNT